MLEFNKNRGVFDIPSVANTDYIWSGINALGAADTINTYGDSRTVFGGANSYRFELYSRQSRSGPFDHGFFFDSGHRLHGGDSPYLN